MDQPVCLVATFYRFAPLPDYRDLKARLLSVAGPSGIRGTILLAEEGVNATIAGSPDEIGRFFEAIGDDPRFADLESKFSTCEAQPFGKLKVRLKKEIVRLKATGSDPNLGVGRYVEPEEWNAVIQDPATTVIDVRNRYETELGTFEGAVDPQTEEFWEFPRFAEDHLTDKDKPVAMFCTGGIRCEKATAYLVQRGYTQVMHLRGGILNYLAKVPEDQSLWRGECFVFDERVAVDHALRPSRRD